MTLAPNWARAYTTDTHTRTGFAHAHTGSRHTRAQAMNPRCSIHVCGLLLLFAHTNAVQVDASHSTRAVPLSESEPPSVITTNIEAVLRDAGATDELITLALEQAKKKNDYTWGRIVATVDDIARLNTKQEELAAKYNTARDAVQKAKDDYQVALELYERILRESEVKPAHVLPWVLLWVLAYWSLVPFAAWQILSPCCRGGCRTRPHQD